MTLYGIDVSSNQPKDIVSRVQNDFAIVKVSGNPKGFAWNYINPYCAQQAADAMKKHGRLGLYHFTYGLDANTEADFFVEQVQKLGYLGKAMLVIDYEGVGALNRGQTWVKKFADRVKSKAGYAPVIYASGSVIVGQSLFSLGYPIWCANYYKGYEHIYGYDTSGCVIYPGCEKSILWQYTSFGILSGYDGELDCNVFFGSASDWQKYTGGKASTPASSSSTAAQSSTTATKKIERGKVAAAIHADMCADNANGYSWSPRFGEDGLGDKTVKVDGQSYVYDRGSYDCSSSCITAWKAALAGTKYAHSLDGATYTGNMRSVFVGSGLFEWKPMSFLAEPGDLYLNEVNHVAMCQTQYPDVLSEFSINENGEVYGGAVGDQTGREAWVHDYYDYPWDGILHYNGKADTVATENGSTAQNAQSGTSTQTSTKLAVDGILGKLTIKELQRQLGVTVDGIFGKQTTKALQKKLKVKQDGVFGQITKKALQKKLKVAQDGIIGKITIKALQRALNKGEIAKW